MPFRAAVDAGTSSVMVGHLDVRAVDPRTPSSLSHAVVTGLLRDELGFRGVAFTDSLQMAAVAARFGSAGSAVRALRAGEDVLLMPPDPRAARDGIVAAVRDGRLPQARLDQAATRMVALLLHQRDQRAPAATRRLQRRGVPPAVGGRDHLGLRAVLRAAGRPAGAGHRSGVRRWPRFRAAAASAGLRVVGPAPRTGRKKPRPPRATTVRLVDSTGAPPAGTWSSRWTRPTRWAAAPRRSGSRPTARPPARSTRWFGAARPVDGPRPAARRRPGRAPRRLLTRARVLWQGRGMSPDDVRSPALALDGATERDHHGFPSFRTARRIFATVPDAEHLHVMLGEEDIRAAVAEWPAWCEEKWWGKTLRRPGSRCPTATRPWWPSSSRTPGGGTPERGPAQPRS